MKDFVRTHVHWLGHDSFRITGKKTVYFDPFELKQAPLADIVFCTHEHFDHCSPNDIKLIQDEKTLIVGTDDALVKVHGNKREVQPGDRFSHGDIQVEVVPAYNLNKKFHLREFGWVGYIVTIDGVRIYHAGDTDRIPEMKGLKADIALLPVSGTYVMTPEEAAEAAIDIQPQLAIPMHYGSIVGSNDDARKFVDLLKGKIEVMLLERET